MSAKQSALSAIFLMQALQWIEKLNPKLMKDIALGRVMLDVSHGKDDRDLEDWRRAMIEAATDRDYPKTHATGYFVLVASIAIRAIEQIHRLDPTKNETDRDCPSCTLGKSLSGLAEEGTAEVHVIEGAEVLAEFLEMLRGAMNQR